MDANPTPIGLLSGLAGALDNAFISTWQSTAGWQRQLDEAKEYLAAERVRAAAPDLLAQVEAQYIELADYTNDWPGRHTLVGQRKLADLRDLIAAATGRSSQDVQDDYGFRAANARSAG